MDNQNIEKNSTSKYIISLLIIIEIFLIFSRLTGLFIIMPYDLMSFLIPVIYLAFLFYYYNLAKRGFNFGSIGKIINIFAGIILVFTVLTFSYIVWGKNEFHLGLWILGLIPILGGIFLVIIVLLFFSLTMFIINKLIKK
ncbi:MAG: hypothetical protein WC446_02460 [Candidatus Paceibacterota bacterium]|jgi:hypothetical protein